MNVQPDRRSYGGRGIRGIRFMRKGNDAAADLGRNAPLALQMTKKQSAVIAAAAFMEFLGDGEVTDGQSLKHRSRGDDNPIEGDAARV